MFKLHLGCGKSRIPGWINIDKYEPGVVNLDAVTLDGIIDESVSEIYTSHMVEHLLPEEFVKALKRWFNILEQGGLLRIRCPDVEYRMRVWLEATDVCRYRRKDIINNPILGDQYRDKGLLHKNLFTKGLLEIYVKNAGFEIISSKNVKGRTPTQQNRLLREGIDEGSDGLADILLVARRPNASQSASAS